MWFKHPKYKQAKKCFIAEVSASNLSNLSYHLPKILFICGGDPKYLSNRHIIEKYIQKHETKFLFFRAEYAWDVITKKGKEIESTNALALEEWLAAFSDAVIILVESFGTVAELGAFSISDPLRKKLLPILDKNYKKDESFINTGPVAWVDTDSLYKPCIYADFDAILTCMPQVISQLKNGASKYESRKTGINLIGKHRFTKKELLFYIIYIVTSLGPINEKEIIDITYKTIDFGKSKKEKEKEDISFILSLCIALGLASYHELNNDIYYACFNYSELYKDETTKRVLTMSQHMRARCLSDLLYISEYKELLQDMNNVIT